jgi:hypothetical protein
MVHRIGGRDNIKAPPSEDVKRRKGVGASSIHCFNLFFFAFFFYSQYLAASNSAIVSFTGYAEARMGEHEARNVLKTLDDLFPRFAQISGAFFFHHLVKRE